MCKAHENAKRLCLYNRRNGGECQDVYKRQEDPCAQARQFVEAGARYLHVVDLDGAKDGTLSNYGSIAALAKQGGLYIEVGGGIRTEERIEKYLSLGVDRCV